MADIYLLRHADAGVRDHAAGPDEERPLSERGWRQARALCDQMGDVGIERLVASPYRRCLQTLEPLAERLGIEVEPDPRLAEGMGAAGALALADELAERPAAMCSHGDVIPDLLDALTRRGLRLHDELRWPKASAWVLTRRPEGWAQARYLPPPA